MRNSKMISKVGWSLLEVIQSISVLNKWKCGLSYWMVTNRFNSINNDHYKIVCLKVIYKIFSNFYYFQNRNQKFKISHLSNLQFL